MSNLSALRATVAGYYTGNFYQTSPYPPQVPLPNSIIVTSGDPYVELVTLGPVGTIRANFTLVLTVPMMDNQGGLNAIEALIEEVLDKTPSGVTLRNASRPSVMSLPSGDLLTSEIQIQVLATI